MKNIKYRYLTVLLFFLANSAFAQSDTISKQWLHVGYFGENITHFGLSGGYGYSFWDSFKKRKNVHFHQLYVEGNFSFLIHPNNQAVFFLIPELGYRYTKNSNWYLQFTAGAGLLRTFYLAKTFEADEDGGFKGIPMAGKWSLGSSFSAGFGKSIIKQKDLFLFTQIRLINEHFYNQKTLLRPIFQLGLLKQI